MSNDKDWVARPTQIEDLSRLISNPRTGLFHSPGGGKTAIAALMSQYIWDCAKEAIVWTQPGGIMEKNKDEILQVTDFAPDEVAMVQGTAFERGQILNDPRKKVFLMTGVGLSKEYELFPKRIKHMVNDECHLYYTTHDPERTKNWYRASRRMANQLGALIPMTGTVIRGRLDSAYPILHQIGQSYYGNDRMFMMHHAVYDENGSVCGWKNHERLRDVLQQVGIFRSFKEIYGEEQVVFQVTNVHPGLKTFKAYKEYEQTGLLEMEDDFVDSGAPASNAQKAMEILGSPRDFGIDEDSAKDKILEPMIEDMIKSGERLAIFSAHTKEQLRLVKIIAKLGGRVGHINGTVPNGRRQVLDKEFQTGETQFIVASPDTAGIGFNWGFLDTIIFYSMRYTDDSFLQAYRRGVRGKRESPLRVLIFHFPETIEDRILQVNDRKSLDHALVNPNIEALRLFQLAYRSPGYKWRTSTAGV